MGAVRIDGHDGARVRVVIADFALIHRGGYGRDFNQAQRCRRVNHAGIDRQSLAVNDLRPGGNGRRGTDGGNPAVPDDQRAALDGFSADRHQSGVADGHGHARRNIQLLLGKGVKCQGQAKAKSRCQTKPTKLTNSSHRRAYSFVICMQLSPKL